MIIDPSDIFNNFDKAPFVLCQDCLTVMTYTDDRHNEIEFCHCGGQLCGCFFCNKQALELVT